MRKIPEVISVKDLNALGVRIVSLDRDASVPKSDDLVITKNWVRPRLLGWEPVLLVREIGKGTWENIGEKRQKNKYRSTDVSDLNRATLG